MSPAHSAAGRRTRDERDDLDKLAAELRKRGCLTRVSAPRGRLPRLEARNPRVAHQPRRIYAQDGMFCWPWADPISPCDQIPAAADTIIRALHARHSQPAARHRP